MLKYQDFFQFRNKFQINFQNRAKIICKRIQYIYQINHKSLFTMKYLGLFLISFIVIIQLAFAIMLTTDGSVSNKRQIDLKSFAGGIMFYGSQAQTGFSLADGGIRGENRTLIIGARASKKTFILNYMDSDIPLSVNLDDLDENNSLVISAQYNVPYCIYVIQKAYLGWIPSLLLTEFGSTAKGTAYTISGNSMEPGNFSLDSINQSDGHVFIGGYSAIQNDRCGSAGSTGDLNGDGYTDIAIGCRDGSYAAVVYGGPQSGIFPQGLDLASITNTTGVIITSGCNCGLGGGYLGYGITFGYFNDDNISDIAISASWGYSNNPFRVHVIYGRQGGYASKSINVNSIPSGYGYTIISNLGNHDCTSLTAGKFTNDEGSGYTDDLIIGDSTALSGPAFNGRVIIIFGQKGGFQGTTLNIASLTAQTGLIIEGSNGAFGMTLQLIKTTVGKRKHLFTNQPFYSTSTRINTGRVFEISSFNNSQLVYNIEDLLIDGEDRKSVASVIYGNDGDYLGGPNPGATSIVGVKNSKGLEDVFLGAVGGNRAYLLFSN